MKHLLNICNINGAEVELGRNSYGFEVDKNFYKAAKEQMLSFETDEANLFDMAQ